MSANDHLKIASSELAKASNVVRQEIDQLRDESARLQQSADEQIVRMTDEMKIHETEAGRSEDPSLQAHARSAISTLQRHMAERKAQLSTEQKKLQQTIKEKERLISDLDQQAKSIG